MNSFSVKISGAAGLFKGTHIVQALVAGLIASNLLVFYGIFFSSQGILGYRQQSKQVEDLTGKVQKLKEQNQKLFRKIQALKNDALAQEKLVRQHLGWVRENELIIEFVPPRKDAP